MQSCNTPCTGTEYPIHMGTVPLKEEEEEEVREDTRAAFFCMFSIAKLPFEGSELINQFLAQLKSQDSLNTITII